MKTHQMILRRIAEQNLDPKVPYVAGKNGILVPKSIPQEGADDASKEESLEEKPVLMGAVVEDVSPTNTIVDETIVKQEVVETPKKKSSPFKKKKTAGE